MPRIQDLPTSEERRVATRPARQAARYKYAAERIRKIVDTAPPLSAEQLDKLATLLRKPA